MRGKGEKDRGRGKVSLPLFKTFPRPLILLQCSSLKILKVVQYNTVGSLAGRTYGSTADSVSGKHSGSAKSDEGKLYIQVALHIGVFLDPFVFVVCSLC